MKKLRNIALMLCVMAAVAAGTYKCILLAADESNQPLPWEEDPSLLAELVDNDR